MSDLIKYEQPPALAFSNDEIAVFKQSYAQELNATEFKLFIRTCQVRGLQPGRHLIANVYNKRDPQKRKLVWITTIDGALSIAESTGEYDGTTEPTLFVEDSAGEKTEIPHRHYDPEEYRRIISATIGVRRKRFSAPVFGTALFKSFAKTGVGSEVWQAHGDLMIIKCALMQALRKAFPEKVGGLYDQAEMQGMEGGAVDVEYQTVTDSEASEAAERLMNAQEAAPPPVDDEEMTDIEKDFCKAVEYWQALAEGAEPRKVEDLIYKKACEAFDVQQVSVIDPKHRKDVQKFLNKDVRFHLTEAGLVPERSF